MAYILSVNPNILSGSGMNWGSVFTATAVSAAIATLVMGFVANLPVALAPGLGLNAFFTYTVVLEWDAAGSLLLLQFFLKVFSLSFFLCAAFVKQSLNQFLTA